MTLPAQDIVERLRAMPTCSCAGDGTESPNLYEQAADTISRLTADNEALRKERDEARAEASALLKSAAAKGDEPDILIIEWQNERRRADALAQEVERLREANEKLGRALFWFSKYPEFKPNTEMMAQWLADLEAAKPFIPARTALANEEAGR